MYSTTLLDNISIIKLELTSDEEFLLDLAMIRKLCKDEDITRTIIDISLVDLNVWIGANTACNLLAFIEDVMSSNYNISLKIRLFDDMLLNEMRTGDYSNVNDKLLKQFTDRLRFYYRWEVAVQIFRIRAHYDNETNTINKIVCYPTDITFGKLIKQFHDSVYFDQSKYSSTLMPLSALDTDELTGVNKMRADKRIKNLILILWTHFHSHDVQTLVHDESSSNTLSKLNQIRHLSAVLMYELIKNIYQHANAQSNTSMLGFTTVQITPRSTLNYIRNKFYPVLPASISHRKDSLLSLLAYQEETCMEFNSDSVRFLTISICDIGVGIPNSIKAGLSAKEVLPLLTDLYLIRKAIFTPFTTKHGSHAEDSPEFYYTSDEKIKLSRRGFGWITAALFIASQMGTFNITSNNVSVTYRTTVYGHGRILDLLQSESTIETAEDIFSNPSTVFEEVMRELPNNCQVAGTRITIEIPIIYRWQKSKYNY